MNLNDKIDNGERFVIGVSEFDFHMEDKVYPCVRLYVCRFIEKGLKPCKDIVCKKSVIDDFDNILNSGIEVSYNEYGKVKYIKVLR